MNDRRIGGKLLPRSSSSADMKELIRAVVCAVALLGLVCLVDGCGSESESEGAVVERPPEGGSEFDVGPVLIAGVVGGHSRFGPHFANVLVWSDGVAMIGPLKEGRWRWTKLREERVSEILSALEREGVAKSRHPEMVKGFSSYLVVACRCDGKSRIAWVDWEASREGLPQKPLSGIEAGLNAFAIQELTFRGFSARSRVRG